MLSACLSSYVLVCTSVCLQQQRVGCGRLTVCDAMCCSTVVLPTRCVTLLYTQCETLFGGVTKEACCCQLS